MKKEGSLKLQLRQIFLPNARMERIFKLAQVDFGRRYNNDRLGLFWALLDPLMKISIYYLVFKEVFNVKMENYGLFIFCGFLLWRIFAEGCNRGMKLFRSKSYLINTIQIQKTDIFVSFAASLSISLAFNLSAYLLIAIAAGITFSWSILFLPLIVANVLLFASAASMLLATLRLYLEDIAHVIDIVLLFGFWTSGIFFRGQIFADKFPFMVYVNPFISLIENARAILMYKSMPDIQILLYTTLYGILMWIICHKIMLNFSDKAVEKI